MCLYDFAVLSQLSPSLGWGSTRYLVWSLSASEYMTYIIMAHHLIWTCQLDWKSWQISLTWFPVKIFPCDVISSISGKGCAHFGKIKLIFLFATLATFFPKAGHWSALFCGITKVSALVPFVWCQISFWDSWLYLRVFLQLLLVYVLQLNGIYLYSSDYLNCLIKCLCFDSLPDFAALFSCYQCSKMKTVAWVLCDQQLVNS